MSVPPLLTGCGARGNHAMKARKQPPSASRRRFPRHESRANEVPEPRARRHSGANRTSGTACTALLWLPLAACSGSVQTAPVQDPAPEAGPADGWVSLEAEPAEGAQESGVACAALQPSIRVEATVMAWRQAALRLREQAVALDKGWGEVCSNLNLVLGLDSSSTDITVACSTLQSRTAEVLAGGGKSASCPRRKSSAIGVV